MSLTPEMIQRNRNTLSANLIRDLGLAENKSDWTYSERVNYIKRFADFVVSHPFSFSDQDVQNAKNVLGKNYTSIEDTSFDLGAFTDAVAVNAIPILGEVGSTLRTVVYIAAIGAVLYFLVPHLLESRHKPATA